jgi:phenylalanyl-tRNA synthetase beta chain
MKLTWSWLQEHVETSASIQEVCHRLTMLGLELESVQDASEKLAPFVVAQIIEASPHPDADKLQVCRVDAGDGGPPLQVVCGAPNARAGLKTALGRPGAVVPASGVTLKLAKVRGVESAGMLCSARELSLSDAHEGIMELPADAVVGAPLAAALGLNDPVIDLSVTPNRVDCMGVRGIAREVIAAGMGRWTAASAAPIAPVAGGFPCPVEVRIEEGSGCAVFASRLIRGVKNGPSPAWMQAKLKAVGLRPISALVDITNFLTLDRCRPLHVFDAAKLTGGLVVKAAQGGETLSALNGKAYTLEAGMTVIADGAGAQSLGGVVGGEATGVSDETTDVLLECAWFEPSRVAQTGRTLKIDSDARYRFERGVDPASTLDGLEQATRLILDICGGEASAAQVAGEEATWRRVIRLRHGRIAQLVGLAVPPDEARQILTNLGFTVVDAQDQPGAWDVSPPSWRRDVEGEADLVEEVARVYGYDHIPVVMPAREGGFPKPALDPRQRNAVRVRRLLASRGLVEAVTWSFVDSKVAARFTDGALNPGLFVANPIAAQFDYMRPSVLPALLQAVARNEAYGQADVSLFEVGPQFHDPSPGGQHLMASGVRAGALHDRHWLSARRAVDAFDAKADALAVLALCGVDGSKAQLVQQAPGYYHPGRSARLQLGPKNILACFGELHPEVLKALDIRAASVVAFEVFLERAPLPKGAKGPREPYVRPPFPSVSRDFAFTVSRDVTAERIINAAKAVDKKLIEAVEVFDVYEGEHMEAGKKSVAFSVRLQPTDKTLTDAEIESTRQAIIARVTKDTQGELRA